MINFTLIWFFVLHPPLLKFLLCVVNLVCLTFATQLMHDFVVQNFACCLFCSPPAYFLLFPVTNSAVPGIHSLKMRPSSKTLMILPQVQFFQLLIGNFSMISNSLWTRSTPWWDLSESVTLVTVKRWFTKIIQEIMLSLHDRKGLLLWRVEYSPWSHLQNYKAVN